MNWFSRLAGEAVNERHRKDRPQLMTFSGVVHRWGRPTTSAQHDACPGICACDPKELVMVQFATCLNPRKRGTCDMQGEKSRSVVRGITRALISHVARSTRMSRITRHSQLGITEVRNLFFSDLSFTRTMVSSSSVMGAMIALVQTIRSVCRIWGTMYPVVPAR
jgi:hypothetical protein